jgi:hypothetical protein
LYNTIKHSITHFLKLAMAKKKLKPLLNLRCLQEKQHQLPQWGLR